ncbi:hypothetical protein ACHAW5_009386 [Stephanodiscus triporus]|uniref:RING-type E3 ubiquitin transferase n=1 Tax=Stephanodiscus triporus TaxID=2934178 RepID=A0ABD3PKM5_9STRA
MRGLRASAVLRPFLRYCPMSMIAAVLLIVRTLRTRRQFYIAMTYLQTSKLSYVVLGNAVIAFSVGLFGAVTSLFLDGGLRPNERDSIGENIRWDVTETCLALTIFRSELDVFTAVEFLVLVVMKCLHWSVELRGGHLRMTEEVFIYPDEEEEDEYGVDREGRRVILPKRGSRWSWWSRQRMPRLRLTHVSYYSLVVMLLCLDVLAVAHCALSVATHGPSVDILFGFEAAILLVSGLSTMGMYHLHVIDGVMGVFHHLADGEHHRVPVGGLAEADERGGATPSNDVGGGGLAVGGGEGGGAEGGGRRPQDHQPAVQEGGMADASASASAAAPADRSLSCPPAMTRTRTLARKLVERLANPWRDRRAMLSFAIELQAQAAKFLFYVVFFAIVFTYVSAALMSIGPLAKFLLYGMPINIFREVYVSLQQLRRRLIAFNTYRRLTHNMDKRFESIKDEEELDRLGHTCIICRDSMDLLGGCKKLPGCGHAFHTHCLRDWLVQQQTCPTCRSDIAANEARNKKSSERAAAAAAAAEAAEELPDAAAIVVAGDGETVADPAVAPAPAPGDNANAVVAANDAATPRLEYGQQAQKTTGASQLDQRPMSTLTSPNDDDALPPGWTQHFDECSGRAYYFNRGLGKTTWEKPAGAKTALAEVPSSQRKEIMDTIGFPCLYRITHSTGAKVYDRRAVQQRLVPRGKLIICTSIEDWPNMAMLRMPDGYVRARDVEQFLMLPTTQQEEDVLVKKRAAE